MIESTFRRSVRTHGLFSPGDRVIVAVSGGPDSVGLLRLLLRHAESCPLEVLVGHVNHGVRGARADADEEFVRNLASELDVEFIWLAPASRGGERASEERLRRLRHALLRRAAARAGASRIALGHTMDDQAETVLMRLLRGTGRRGLSGMAFAGPGRLVRPLLGIRREAVREWLAAIGQPYREDETNKDMRYLRNKVRARVLPLLAELNPSIVPALARTAAILGEEDRYLDEIAAESLARDARPSRIPDGARSAAADARALARMPRPIARRMARLLIKEGGGDPRGATLSAVEDLLDLAGASGERAARPLGGRSVCELDGGDIVIRASASAAASAGEAAPLRALLPIPGRIEIPETGGALIASLHERDDPPPAGPRRAHLDAALLGDAVTVRNRQPGDRFHPLGAPGGRKLKEFLIDCKVPRRERDRIPLVVGPAGIAWVVGQRIAHTYRVRNSTRRVAVIDYEGPDR